MALLKFMNFDPTLVIQPIFFLGPLMTSLMGFPCMWKIKRKVKLVEVAELQSGPLTLPLIFFDNTFCKLVL